MEARRKNNQQALDALQQDITSNNVAESLAKEATQLVFGAGNPDADIVFIGEAPGKQEDAQGLPFFGAAGKLLDELLASVSLRRDDVYITNIVKYRPPNNRDPLPEEKKVFLPYLHKQLQIIRPSLVVTLGRHSMESFLPNQRISQIHGQPKRIKVSVSAEEKTIQLVILPLYHPAAALYNGGLRKTLLEDFSRVPEILTKIHTT
jgi:DNA polymerase